MNDNITEINKDTFWKLIQSAKETCGQDMDAMTDFLKDRLRISRTSSDCGMPPGS